MKNTIKYYIITIFIAVISSLCNFDISAQNIENFVINSDFSEFINCPLDISRSIDECVGWNRPISTWDSGNVIVDPPTTPDYYNECAPPSGKGVPCNLQGS